MRGGRRKAGAEGGLVVGHASMKMSSDTLMCLACLRDPNGQPTRSINTHGRTLCHSLSLSLSLTHTHTAMDDGWNRDDE